VVLFKPLVLEPVGALEASVVSDRLVDHGIAHILPIRVRLLERPLSLPALCLLPLRVTIILPALQPLLYRWVKISNGYSW